MNRTRLTVAAAALFSAAAVAVPGSASAYAHPCGATRAQNGAYTLHIGVYRVKGSVSCSKAKSLARSVVGHDCQGERIRGYKCTHGASSIGVSSANGFTLRRGSTVIEAVVH